MKDRRSPRRRLGGWMLCGLALGVAACAGGPEPAEGPAPEPAGEAAAERPEAELEATARDCAREVAVARERARRERALAEGRLPEIPADSGPLRLEVRYPSRAQRLTVRDSNFVFGTVGTGDAALWIDGTAVPVEPNGAFLAWVPVPPARGDTATYTLVARRGIVADTLRLPVRLPPGPLRARPGIAVVDSSFLREIPPRWALPGESVPLEVRGAPGLSAHLESGGLRVLLHAAASPGGGVVYRGAVPAAALREAGCAAEGAACRRSGGPPDPVEAEPSAAVGAARPNAVRAARVEAAGEPASGPWALDTLPVRLVAAADGDTVRLERRLPLGVLDPASLPLVRLAEDPSPTHGARGVVVGRPTPYGPYRWRFPPGARVHADGRIGDRVRLRIGPDLHAWVAAGETVALRPGAAGPPATVADVRAVPDEDRVTLRLGLDVPVPAHVDEPDPRTLWLTLHGAHGGTGRVAYGGTGGLVESLRWEQLPGDRYRLEVRTAEPLWGWELAYETGDSRAYEGPRDSRAGGVDDDFDGGPVLRLALRRPPRIDRDDPLSGRRIAVDPGHPPAGAYGPTGLYEGDANLGVARELARLLGEEGAEPVLLRLDTLPLGLYERTRGAVASGAELFVSIHNNALPDGVRPFGREGTSTYYYHPHSRDLARAVQRGMLREMGLRDLGVLWGDLAVVRASWMPSVLAEGAFMMIPRHEAALRTEEFRERYARGVLEGIRAFLEERAAWEEEDDGGPR